MRRRDFITRIGAATAAWPLAARAQQPDRVRRIAVLMSVPESDPEAQHWLGAFSEGLQQLGWTAGRNIRLDYRWAAPFDAESRQRVAKELVALQPDLILSHVTPRRPHCCNKRAPSPSSSRLLLIKSAAASSRAFRGRAATLPGSPTSSRRCPGAIGHETMGNGGINLALPHGARIPFPGAINSVFAKVRGLRVVGCRAQW
jgi:hypothetical protein